MYTVNEYVPQGPRDQESQSRPTEQQNVEQDRPDQPTQNPRLPEEKPETEQGSTESTLKDRDNQQPLSAVPGDQEKRNPGDDKEEGERGEEADEMDEENDEEEELSKDRPGESERGRDTSTQNPGDAYQYPSNNPWETNPEDPAQNRKTDAMTDHEPRPAGI